MIEAKAVFRSAIDAWPVEEAGIPIRMLTGCTRLNFKTVGKIRNLSDSDLLAMRGVGVTTVRQWHAYLDLAGKLERGRMQYAHVLEILKTFLDRSELDIVILRYGLRDPRAPLVQNVKTLQEIGDSKRVTRERIRQVEASALERLSSRLAQAGLDPVYQLFEAFLRKQSLVLEAEDFLVWKEEPLWGGLCPGHLMILLSALRKTSWLLYRGYLTRLSRPQVVGLERTLVRLLHHLNRPVSSHVLSEHMGDALARFQQMDTVRLVEVILRHCPDVERSPDGLYYAI